jgi:hypothetical protein
MKGLLKQATGALVLLLAIAIGARVIFNLLVPTLPIIIGILALIVVYQVAFGFWHRL